jgi:hypothetical protein
MKRDLFVFLKDRKVFTSGGNKTLREYLTAQEQQSEYRLRSRRAIKKPRKK